MDRIPLSLKSRHVPLALGTTFNFLRINSAPFVYQQSQTKVRYECLCVRCGDTTEVKYSHLKATQSCGCLTKRDGPRTCKVCGVVESREMPFPSNRFLLCKEHEIQHNKPIRKRAHQKWASRRSESPSRFLAALFHYINQRPKECSITVNDLEELYRLQKGQCALSGLRMLHRAGLPESISVDRKDSKVGYTKDNCQLVCRCLNLAKNQHNDSEIVAFLEAYHQLRCAQRESS